MVFFVCCMRALMWLLYYFCVYFPFLVCVHLCVDFVANSVCRFAVIWFYSQFHVGRRGCVGAVGSRVLLGSRVLWFGAGLPLGRGCVVPSLPGDARGGGGPVDCRSVAVRLVILVSSNGAVTPDFVSLVDPCPSRLWMTLGLLEGHGCLRFATVAVWVVACFKLLYS